MDPCKELQRLLLSGRGFAVDYANPTKNALLITAKDSPAWTNNPEARERFHSWRGCKLGVRWTPDRGAFIVEKLTADEARLLALIDARIDAVLTERLQGLSDETSRTLREAMQVIQQMVTRPRP